ncbi:MAG: phenylalanine--tRNA ligase subunit beta [Candidatus Omnitrophica bacterium]|nr:phenylalanine--tRNA ligase subunit beta [Candidatus Omnitrophota bacterium]
MKVTYNWLKDFVEIKLSPQALADKLTMAGLEVKAIEEKEGDFVFEIEITSNRPDWLSVVGIAREVAAITGKKLNVKSLALNFKNFKHRALNINQFNINIESPKDCPLYTAKILHNVKVGQSPAWLKNRLEMVGCRSINNIVDITNYVLFEQGQPLHAFDLDKLSSKEIIVRRAKQGEKLVTLDAAEKSLTKDILVIADKNNPVAIAGVMGGKDTEVTQDTKNILLEAAVFNPAVVRFGRQLLGLNSESSYRFERGVNTQAVEFASLRATRLMQDLSPAEYIGEKSSGRAGKNKKNIIFDALCVQEKLGIRVPNVQIKTILTHLGFSIKTKSKNALIIGVPGFRPDVNCAEDLIEEIARIYGYEKIKTTIPAVKPQAKFAGNRELVLLTKNILTGLGLNEAITYSLIDRELLSLYANTDAVAEVRNPLSKEQEILRPVIVPSLLRCVSYNLNQNQELVNIFEIAKVYLPAGGVINEELHLGIVLCGERNLLLEQGKLKDKMSLLHVKGILEELASRMGIEDVAFSWETPDTAGAFVNKQKIGIIGCLTQQVLGKLDIKHKDVFILEVSLDKLFNCVSLKKRFTPLPKFPGIIRDISFVVKSSISVKEIIDVIKIAGKPLLENVEVTDYYQGRQIPAGSRGLTISCFYRLLERTLTEEEINPVHTSAARLLTEKFGATLR